MPATVTLSDAAIQWWFDLLLTHAGPPPTSGGQPVTLTTIYEVLQAMSQTQTQEAADVAQLATDTQTLTTALADLKAEIVSLQQAAQQAAGTVPPDLQAKIDALHVLAQTVAPAVAPAPAADMSSPSGPELTPEPQA